MIDARQQRILCEIVRRESRSFLQYVADSFPWTTPEERQLLEPLQTLIEGERQNAARLVQFLIDEHITPPALGSYPAVYTDYNYISLDHLLPLLVREERKAIEDLERLVPGLGDPAAQQHVQELLAAKREHLERLEKLKAAQPSKPAAVS